MLLQSHLASCRIHLLPALPPAWPDGDVTGLRARGAFRVDIRWVAGTLRAVTVAHSSLGTAPAPTVRPSGPVRVCCASSICGTDKARLTSAARVDVRAITPVGALRSESDDVAPNVWTWDVVLDAGTWSMEL